MSKYKKIENPLNFQIAIDSLSCRYHLKASYFIISKSSCLIIFINTFSSSDPSRILLKQRFFLYTSIPCVKNSIDSKIFMSCLAYLIDSYNSSMSSSKKDINILNVLKQITKVNFCMILVIPILRIITHMK